MLYLIIGVVAVLVLAVVIAVRRGAGAARARIVLELAALDVKRQAKANLYGVASAGERQVRSLGTLALTPEELVFFQMVPEKEVRVPRPAITNVEVERSFLGKTQDRDLLVVAWNAGDDEDSVAFDVPDIDSWLTELQPIID